MAPQRRASPREKRGRERMRAPNGAGHFEKVTLANGEERWYYERDFGKGLDGKRIRPQFSGRSMAEVMEKATQFEKNLVQGRPLRPERITVGEYLRG